MEEREFAKYAFLIVAVVAVVGLLTSGGFEVTGFASKKASAKVPAAQAAAGVPFVARAAGSACQAGPSTGRKRCNAPSAPNQVLAEFSCTNNPRMTSWRPDSTCGAGQRCENGACVAQPFCRYENRNGPIGIFEQNGVFTQNGWLPSYFCRGSHSLSRTCRDNQVRESPEALYNDCGSVGCNEATGRCCIIEWVRTDCNGASGTNVSRDLCTGQEVETRLDCTRGGTIDNMTCVPASVVCARV